MLTKTKWCLEVVPFYFVVTELLVLYLQKFSSFATHTKAVFHSPKNAVSNFKWL